MHSLVECIKREVYPHSKICQSFLRRLARHQLGSCGWIVSLGRLWLHTCLLKLNAKVTASCMCTSLQRMLPYFFAAGHWHYARHVTWHLQEMSCLPEDAKSDLMAGAFVCRHREGVWNSVSADQFGEQTYIRNGKSKGGLVGISLSAEQVACWVFSYHLCQRVFQAF